MTLHYYSPKAYEFVRKILYPLYARFVAFKQKGGLVFPSLDIIKIVKATEVVFWRRVIGQNVEISAEKNLTLKIQNSVLESIGGTVFANSSHFFDHTIGERDHLSSLVKVVSKWYLDIQMNTYPKKYSDMVIHRNVPSNRHHLTRTILFSNL